jgi:predicted N-acetyltransferase YhbS
MRHTFANPDFEVLTELWNEFHPDRYSIDQDLLRLNTVQSPVFDWGASSIWSEGGEVCGFVSVKKSAVSLYPGPDQDMAHISAIVYRDARIGVDMLADVKTTLRNRGINNLVFGQDSRHFFPGCPADSKALQSFLMVEGFAAEGLASDLERDLAEYENPYASVPGATMRCVGVDDQTALEEFMEREFPRRWAYDVAHKVRLEAPAACVFGLFFGEKLEGFALIQQSSAKIPIGGAVWRKSLGENWGALGPIGVSAHLRGKGAGGALLGAALKHLKTQGVRQCIIDWTNLLDFYGKFGFEVTREYRSMTLNLESSQGIK